MTRFEILPGLPPYGPTAEAFSATGQGKHREGFVVRFETEAGNGWVGNFQPGYGRYSGVVHHPNGNELIVIARGQAYVVDPKSKQCSWTFGAQIDSVFDIADRDIIVFGNGLWFEAISAEGRLWQSDRISWDGIRNVTVQGSTLTGEAWDLSDDWIPFELDLATGGFKGGSYNH